MAHPFTRSELGIYATVSEQLRKAREHRELSLETCAQRTEIQKKFLTSIEESHFEELPGEIYARAWIKKYAALLGLNTADIMISYEKERDMRKRMEIGRETRVTVTKIRLWSFLTLRRLSIIILVTAVLTYIGYLVYETVSPPHISFEPAQGFKTQQDTILFRGQTEQGAILTINQKPIAIDTLGMFQEEIPLHEGLNTITILAKKKNSRSFMQEIPIARTLPPTVQSATTTGP